MSIVSVLVAIAVMGIAAVIMNTMLQRTMGGMKAAENDAEFDDLRKMLRSRVSCTRTATEWAKAGIKGTTCTDVAPIYDEQGNVVISNSNNSASKVGRWTLRAVCMGPGNGVPANEYGLDIQAARPRDTAKDKLHSQNKDDFAPDPWRPGFALDWKSANSRGRKGYESASSLFMKNSRMCPSLFASTAKGPPQPVKCKTDGVKMTRTGSPLDKSNFRSADFVCPDDYPFAMSSNPPFVCMAPGAESAVFQDGSDYPRRMHCAVMFFRDVYGPTTAEAKQREKTCQDFNLNPDETFCGGVCCTFTGN